MIWVTKYRNQTFTTEALSNEMKAILQQVADNNDIVIEKMEVMPDHIHMLISFPPSKAPASAIKALKGRSAYIFYKIIQKQKSQFMNVMTMFHSSHVGLRFT